MNLDNLYFKFLHRYYTFIYSIRYGVISNCINALWALQIAWMFLRGKLLIITTEDAVSKGGFKYKTVTFSKRPVSSLHTYKGF